MKQSVAIVTLGCPRNTVDSEKLAFYIQNKGFKIASTPEKADIVIVNTCGFIQSAKEESIETLKDIIELKKYGKVKSVIAWGCLAKRYHNDLVEHLEGIDAVVDVININDTPRIKTTLPHLTYLKISEGCLNKCAYCAIPSIRGSLNSRSYEEIMTEVKQLDKEGLTKELIITAQDSTAWGKDFKDSPHNIKTLLKSISKTVKNIKWIRLMYAHPRFVDEELIDIVAKTKNICAYLDLPIQHINDRLLKLMNRHVNAKQIKHLVSYITTNYPQMHLRTSIICGLPTETKSEFEELLDFIQEYRFHNLGAFIFSKEENTPAEKLKQLPYKTKLKRYDELMLLQQDISLEMNNAHIGKVYDIIIDSQKAGNAVGRTYFQAPDIDGVVYIKTKAKVGDIIKGEIISASEYDLEAKEIK